MLLSSACGVRPPDCTRRGVFCIGLVTDSGSIQQGPNQQAWLGLQDAQAQGLADHIDYIQTMDARDRQANIQTFVRDGYDLIITVGPLMTDDTILAAQQNPGTKFIGIEQTENGGLPNLTGLVFHEERSGFLAGALAALITRTDHVAALCDSESVDAMRRYCDSFQAGARYAGAGVSTAVMYRTGADQGLFNDPDWGRAAALQAVQNGADVVFAAGGNTAQAALEAAAAQGALVIGSETDQYESLADARARLVSSAVSDIRAGVRSLVVLARQDQLPAGNFFGQVALAPFHDQDEQVAQSVKDQLTGLEQELASDPIIDPVPFQNP